MTNYTKDDLQNWLEHPVTSDLLSGLMNYQEDLKSKWANGNILEHDENLLEIGRVNGVQIIFDMIEQIKDDFKQEEGSDD